MHPHQGPISCHSNAPSLPGQDTQRHDPLVKVQINSAEIRVPEHVAGLFRASQSRIIPPPAAAGCVTGGIHTSCRGGVHTACHDLPNRLPQVLNVTQPSETAPSALAPRPWLRINALVCTESVFQMNGAPGLDVLLPVRWQQQKRKRTGGSRTALYAASSPGTMRLMSAWW